MTGEGRTPSPDVAVFGGTARSAALSCDCGEEFLSTGGEWGDTPSDRPTMPLHDLAALLAAHDCPATTPARGSS